MSDIGVPVLSMDRLKEAIWKRAAYYHGSPEKGIKALNPAKNEEEIANVLQALRDFGARVRSYDEVPEGYYKEGSERLREALLAKTATVPLATKQLRRAMELLQNKQHSFHGTRAPESILEQGAIVPGTNNRSSRVGVNEIYFGADAPSPFWMNEHTSGFAIPEKRIMQEAATDAQIRQAAGGNAGYLETLLGYSPETLGDVGIGPRRMLEADWNAGGRANRNYGEAVDWVATPNPVPINPKDYLVLRDAHGTPGLRDLVREKRVRTIPNDVFQEAKENVYPKVRVARLASEAYAKKQELVRALRDKEGAYKKGSSCVAAMLPPQAANQFPKEDIPGVPKAQQMPPHVTILYCPDLTKTQAVAFEDAVRRAAARVEPFGASSNGLRHFRTSDDQAVAHVKIVSEGSRKLNKLIREELERDGIPYEETHREYRPHSTLKYLQPGNKFQGKVPSFVAAIKEIEIWRDGSKPVRIALGVSDVRNPKAVHRLAELFGVKWDDAPEFLRKSEKLTGEARLDDMEAAQVQTIAQALRARQFKTAASRRSKKRIPRTCKHDNCKAPVEKGVVWADGRAIVHCCAKHTKHFQDTLGDVVATRSMSQMEASKKKAREKRSDVDNVSRLRELLMEANKDPELRGYVHPRDDSRERVPILNGGEAVGFYTPREQEGVRRVGAIYVQPEHRGKGLASQAIRDYMKGYEGKAFVSKDNLASRKAFEAAGFVEGKENRREGGNWFTREKKANGDMVEWLRNHSIADHLKRNPDCGCRKCQRHRAKSEKKAMDRLRIAIFQG